MYGPYGPANSKSPCMLKGHYFKYFSKKFWPETAINENGFAIHKRRDDRYYIMKRWHYA